MNTLNSTLSKIAAGLLAFAVLGGVSFAEPIIDKGDLGKYERHGRFVHRINDADASAPAQNVDATAVASTKRRVIDKGALGQYERHGRFVKRIPTRVERNWDQASASVGKAGVRHEHGINGKEHRNVTN